MQHYFETIHGWFTAQELYAGAVRVFPSDSQFVELGTWKGKSAAFMGVEIANSGKRQHLTTIDTFKGSDEEAHRNDPDIQRGCLKEVAETNLEPLSAYVSIKQSDSAEAAAGFADGSIQFLFIDAGHDYESVKRDISAWLPKMAPNGVISGDDLHWDGVRQAVNEAFGSDYRNSGRCWVHLMPEAQKSWYHEFDCFTGVAIATPCYGSMVTEVYCRSLTRTLVKLDRAGIFYETMLAPGDSLVHRARNSLTSKFLASDFSHMLFIDADLEWEPESVLKLLRANKDVVCGVYPKKAYPIKWPLNFKKDANENINQCPATGVIEIAEAPTGFLMIKRRVFEQMKAKYPELRYMGTPALSPEEDVHTHAFFDTFIDKDHKAPDGTPRPRLVSEDFGFCMRWTAMGGKVWLDPTINLKHYGLHGFEGNLQELFVTEPATNEEKTA